MQYLFLCFVNLNFFDYIFLISRFFKFDFPELEEKCWYYSRRNESSFKVCQSGKFGFGEMFTHPWGSDSY
jgi:hypothetical protein